VPYFLGIELKKRKRWMSENALANRPPLLCGIPINVNTNTRFEDMKIGAGKHGSRIQA
jgi:hypothetical protein